MQDQVKITIITNNYDDQIPLSIYNIVIASCSPWLPNSYQMVRDNRPGNNQNIKKHLMLSINKQRFTDSCMHWYLKYVTLMIQCQKIWFMSHDVPINHTCCMWPSTFCLTVNFSRPSSQYILIFFSKLYSDYFRKCLIWWKLPVYEVRVVVLICLFIDQQEPSEKSIIWSKTNCCLSWSRI